MATTTALGSTAKSKRLYGNKKSRQQQSSPLAVIRRLAWLTLLLIAILFYLIRMFQLSVSITIEPVSSILVPETNGQANASGASFPGLQRERHRENEHHKNKESSASSSGSSSSSSSLATQLGTSLDSAIGNEIATDQIQPKLAMGEKKSPMNRTSSFSPPTFPHNLHNDSFSACLLVMDENHRLPEWLAYHYYMMNLRHLIILSDPRAQTSPAEIIGRWRPYMHIESWTDSHIGLRPRPETALKTQYQRLMLHRDRQNKFYYHCLRHLKIKHKRTWVATHDADEYLYLDPTELPDAIERMSQPGSLLKFVHQWASTRTRSCFTVWRSYFGATESPSDNVVQANVPNGFNGSVFETLRYLYRMSHDSTENGPPKSFVRVSTAPLRAQSEGIHQLLPECKPYGISPPMHIRHYVGSWKAFSSRRDARMGAKRSREYWEYLAALGRNNPPDDAVRHWLSNFVEFVGGVSQAQHLLQGTGELPPPLTNVSSSLLLSWHMTPLNMLEAKKRHQTSFSRWLRNHFDMRTLPNGTFVARRYTPEELEQLALEKKKSTKKKHKK